jgi:WD40 repeat protein
MAPLKSHSEAVYSVAYAPNGRFIASGNRDSTVQIWDADQHNVSDSESHTTMHGATTACAQKGHAGTLTCMMTVVFFSHSKNPKFQFRSPNAPVRGLFSAFHINTVFFVTVKITTVLMQVRVACLPCFLERARTTLDTKQLYKLRKCACVLPELCGC